MRRLKSTNYNSRRLFNIFSQGTDLHTLANLNFISRIENQTVSTFHSADSNSKGPYRQNLHSVFFSQKRFFTTKLLPHLPVVDAVIEKALATMSSLPLRKTAIVYVHHPLQTSVNLMTGLLRLGARPKNIFVLGKHYSECPSIVKQMMDLGVHYQPCSVQIGLGKFYQSFTRDINWLWFNTLTHIEKDTEEVLVLDHGGHALAFIPAQILQKYKVVGIEKTTGGLINLDDQGLPPFPIIGVANCAAKKILESPLIAEAVVTKLLPIIPIKNTNLTCGVVGYGAIGKAVASKLLAMGHKVIVYDNDHYQLKAIKTEGLTKTNELSALISSADYIFGCTGRDITKSIDIFRLASKDKTLISCSSEDKEFLSLLQLIQQKNNGGVATRPLNDVNYHTDMSATIRILKGGFPINFDNSGESVPANDIQLTRALVLAGVLQAIRIFKKPDLLAQGELYALDPSMQNFVVKEWLKHQPASRFPKNITDQFQNKQWIIEHSGGVHAPCDILEDCSVELDVNKEPFCENLKFP